jgi:hypothetical protein
VREVGMGALAVVVTGARRIRRVGALAVALALVASCAKELPTAPTDLATGITIYEHANFLGDSALLTADVGDLKDYDGPCAHQTTTGYGVPYTYYNWNDCVSSIRVAPGWRATIYRDGSFKGESLEVTADVPNLQLVRGSCDHDGLNDCITSIRVRQQ